MKYSLLMFVLCFVLKQRAQNFTNGSVYNYDVGDTIVTGYQAYDYKNTYQPPADIRYRVITQKNVATSSTSIVYTFADVLEKHAPTPPFAPTLQNSVGTFSVSNLNSSAVGPASTDTCMDRVDTTFTGNCGLLTRTLSEKFICGPEIIFFDRTYIEGVGYFYHNYHGGNLMQGTKEYLIAVHKANGSSCGAVGAIPNGINDYTLNGLSITTFPNPCQESLLLKLSRYEASTPYVAELKDLSGKPVKSGIPVQEEITFNMHDLAPGMYLLEIRKKGQLYAIQKILKN